MSTSITIAIIGIISGILGTFAGIFFRSMYASKDKMVDSYIQRIEALEKRERESYATMRELSKELDEFREKYSTLYIKNLELVEENHQLVEQLKKY